MYSVGRRHVYVSFLTIHTCWKRNLNVHIPAKTAYPHSTWEAYVTCEILFHFSFPVIREVWIKVFTVTVSLWSDKIDYKHTSYNNHTVTSMSILYSHFILTLGIWIWSPQIVYHCSVLQWLGLWILVFSFYPYY